MRVNEAVIDRLFEHGIRTVFGNPGKQSLPLNKAIGEHEEMDFIVARHETAVSHEAWGYAETSGRMGATIVIPGPGDMNAMNGLKNALNDCTPLLHIAIETDPDIRGSSEIHETPPDTYDNVVKENILVETPASTIAQLDKVVTIAQTAPKGPVRLGIPKNFLKMDVLLAESSLQPPATRATPAAGAVERAIKLLDASERPIIIAGGGIRASAASAELRAVAEQLDAPVLSTYKGKGVLPADHPLFAGILYGGAPPAVEACLAESDVVLGIGTNLDAVSTRASSIEMPTQLIHVTMEPSDLGTGYQPEIGIVADAGATMALLTDGTEKTKRGGDERAAAVRVAIDDHIAPLRKRTDAPMTSVAALTSIREALSRDTIFTVDAGGFRLWALLTVGAYGPRSYVNPGSWASMGTGLPSGIGAKLANPDRDVVVLTGDGGLMMCAHELHTAATNDLDISVIVLNNNDYAIISEEADRSYHLGEGAYSWTESPVSFSTIAEGFGVDALRVGSNDEIGDAITSAIAADGPSLIEIPTDPREPQAGTWDGTWE